MIDLSAILTEAVKVATLGIIGVVGKVIVSYGPKIAKQVVKIVETKAKEKNLDYALKLAKQVWYQVEEDWKLDEQIRDYYVTKANYFDSVLLAKFKELNPSDIAELRQSIAGEYNKNKEVE